MGKVSTFEDLKVWEESHQLVLMIYNVTKTFPNEEKFGLVSQMRRAAVSVPANIAEGFKRYSFKEKRHFYNVAEGSLEELKYFLILCKDLGYIASKEEFIDRANTVGRLLNGLIRSTQRQQKSSHNP